jgi:hypothetical protein
MEIQMDIHGLQLRTFHFPHRPRSFRPKRLATLMSQSRLLAMESSDLSVPSISIRPIPQDSMNSIYYGTPEMDRYIDPYRSTTSPVFVDISWALPGTTGHCRRAVKTRRKLPANRWDHTWHEESPANMGKCGVVPPNSRLKLVHETI